MKNSLIKQLQDKVNQQEAEIIKLKTEIQQLNTKSTTSFFDVFNKFFVNMPNYVYWKNKNSVYMGCNCNWAKISNLKDPSEIIGKKDEQLIWDNELSERFIEDDIYVIHTGNEHVSIYELPIKREDGNNIWIKTNKIPIRENNEILGIIAIATDITDQKVEYQKVLIDKQFIEDIIYNLPGLIYWKNKKSQYIGFNKNVVHLSGLDRNSLLGKSDTELNWGSKEAESFIKDDNRVMDTGEVSVTEYEIPIKRPDGKHIVVKTEKSQLKNRDGDIVGVLGVAIDVTDQKELEKKLIAEKDKSDQANLVKTEFIRNMEHDIRTPFSGIWGMANYLYEKETDETKKEYLKDIVQSAKELLNYCNAILDFSKVESGMLGVVEKKFSLEKIVNSAIKMEFSAAKYKGLDLKLSYDPNIPPVVVGDSYRIYRILINLIGNAIKFTKEGYVEVKVLLITKEVDSIFIRFIIEDTGIGIPIEKQQFIFEKFTRLTQSNRGLYKGIGLGLRVVKQFVNEMGGEIDLVSKEDKGTKFICTIPFSLPLTNDFVE